MFANDIGNHDGPNVFGLGMRVKSGVLSPVSCVLLAVICSSMAPAFAETTLMHLDPLASIEVGPRDEVGKKTLGEKATEQVVGGVLGRVFGGGSRRSSRSQGPRTRRDPTRKLDYFYPDTPEQDLSVGVRARWTDDGLLVSGRIDEDDETGTFQTLYIQDCQNRRLYPAALEMYKIWAEHRLTVSWTKTTTVDGRVVSRETGGWSENWNEDLGTFTVGQARKMPAVWQQLGFDRAHGGARQIGAYFQLTPADLEASGPLAMIVHVTRPEQDPVITHPLLWKLRAAGDGVAVVPGDLSAVDSWIRFCERLTGAAGPETIAAGDEPPGMSDSLSAVGDPGSSPPMPIPDGLELAGPPASTGETTGVIGYIQVHNPTDNPIVFSDGPALIPAADGHQGYIVPGGAGTTVPAGATARVPIEGYCSDVRKPPVPENNSLPPPEDWIVPDGAEIPVPAKATPGEVAPGRALVPGSDVPVPRTIDPDQQPEAAAPYLLRATEEIIRTVEELQREGELQTPISADPERERKAVIQQVIWRYAAELAGRPYTQEEFTGRLEDQYRENAGIATGGKIPEPDRERIRQGSDDFWNSFRLVGEKAKVMDESEEPVVPTGDPPPEAAQALACSFDRNIEHSDFDSDFVMSESYQDEDKRANLKEWFADLPAASAAPEGGTFEATRHPASAWAMAGRNMLGGYGNAVAKHIYQEAGGGTDWVWSTELLEVDAESQGLHVLSVAPPAGADCDTIVVGATGGVVEAWTNVIDPIAETRDIIEALRVTRDIAIIVASATLAPVTAGASIAIGVGTLSASRAFDAEFSSDADAAVAVEGRMQVQVKRRRLSLDAHSRSTLSGDGDIESDATRVYHGVVSDQDPVRIDASTAGIAVVKARAESNGIAEGTLESQTGVAIAAFCVCGDAVSYEYLTDAGVFIAAEGAAGVATAAIGHLEEMLGELIEPYLELPPEQIVPQAGSELPAEMEEMLRDWYLENGSGEGRPGYFELTN